MTDRVKGLTVILERDFREDDIEIVMDAISIIRGVQKVTKVLATHDDFITRSRTFDEIEKAVTAALFKARKDGGA